MLCCIVFKNFYASLYVCEGFGCVWILVSTNELYFGLDAIRHLKCFVLIVLCVCEK
jgi:hypothetical protein